MTTEHLQPILDFGQNVDALVKGELENSTNPSNTAASFMLGATALIEAAARSLGGDFTHNCHMVIATIAKNTVKPQ